MTSGFIGSTTAIKYETKNAVYNYEGTAIVN